MKEQTFTSLPIIDISALVSSHQVRSCRLVLCIILGTGRCKQYRPGQLAQDEERKAHVARQLHDACCNVGFFYTTGHGEATKALLAPFTHLHLLPGPHSSIYLSQHKGHGYRRAGGALQRHTGRGQAVVQPAGERPRQQTLSLPLL
jgi:hypothetical protein